MDENLYCGICDYCIASIGDGYCYKYDIYLEKQRQPTRPDFCKIIIEEGKCNEYAIDKKKA